MEGDIPPRLIGVSLPNVFVQISKEMAKKKKDLYVSHPNSVYGKALKTVANLDSNRAERSYIQLKWTEHVKVNYGLKNRIQNLHAL